MTRLERVTQAPSHPRWELVLGQKVPAQELGAGQPLGSLEPVPPSPSLALSSLHWTLNQKLLGISSEPGGEPGHS